MLDFKCPVCGGEVKTELFIGAVLDEMPEATRKDVDAARKRVGKHGSRAYMVCDASRR